MFEDILDTHSPEFSKIISDCHQILGEFFFEVLDEETLKGMMIALGKYLKQVVNDYTMTGKINGRNIEIYVNFKDFGKEVTFII